MRDRAPGVMREPAHERDRVDARDRLARRDFPGRDHVERGGAMRGSKIRQRLGGALEILGHVVAGCGGAATELFAPAIVRANSSSRCVARSGGDRKVGGGSRRVAHRLRAQSRGAQLFGAVRRDARLRHRLDRIGEPARMIERMHGAREPGVAFVGRRRVGFRQKSARLPHAVRRLRQCRFVESGERGLAAGSPRRVRSRSRGRAFRARARPCGAPPRPRPSASAAKPDRDIS